MGGNAIILKAPLYLQRPVAVSIYMVTLLLSFYIFESPVNLEWFLPMLFFEFLISPRTARRTLPARIGTISLSGISVSEQ